MQVLVALATQPGELLTRQQLLDEVWGDSVVGDEVLSRAISLLRSALGDARTQPAYIRTVPRQGYVLVSPVRPLPASKRKAHWRIAALGVAVVSAALLWWWSVSTTPRTVSLAILPPSVLATDTGLAVMSERIAAHLITELSQDPALQIVARRASFGVRDTQLNLEVIARRLPADYLLEGTLQPQAAAWHLDLFLVDINAGTHLWSLKVSADNLEQLQTNALQAARTALTEVLGVRLQSGTQIATAIPDLAYQKYLEARYQWTLRGEKRIARSIALLRESLALADNFIPAYVALAQSLASQPFYPGEDDTEISAAFTEARALLRQAQTLAGTPLADARALEGFMRMKEWQWVAAGDALQRALQIDPDNLIAHYWYSIYLAQLGHYHPSVEHLQHALTLDPVSAVLNDRMALAQVHIGALDAAAGYFDAAAELGYLESTQPLSRLLYLYRRQDWSAMRAYLRRIGGDPVWVDPLVDGLQDPQQRARATAAINAYGTDALLDELKVPTWVLYGDTARAFADFTPTPTTQLIEFLWIDEAAAWRAEPQFVDLLSRLGLGGAAHQLLPATSKP